MGEGNKKRQTFMCPNHRQVEKTGLQFKVNHVYIYIWVYKYIMQVCVEILHTNIYRYNTCMLYKYVQILAFTLYKQTHIQSEVENKHDIKLTHRS